MLGADTAIIPVTDDTLASTINSATRRLVAMAPAFTLPVADAIARQWHRLGPHAVNVILDGDPEVYRLGYGIPEALDLLAKTAQDLRTTLNRQPGIRIGLIIADDETLICTPTALLIEAGGKESVKPNAIRLSAPPPAVERDLGQGPGGLADQRVGLDALESNTIAETKADLQANPPQKFDVARQVRVFNAQFEFVELRM